VKKKVCFTLIFVLSIFRCKIKKTKILFMLHNKYFDKVFSEDGLESECVSTESRSYNIDNVYLKATLFHLNNQINDNKNKASVGNISLIIKEALMYNCTKNIEMQSVFD
jgi:rhamnogalacturonyl hydrolase YesR